MYSPVLLRTSGSGDSLDGTWEDFNGGGETWKCGDETEAERGFGHTSIEIVADTYTGASVGTLEYLFDGQSVAEDSELVHNGTIETDGDLLLFNDEPNGEDFRWEGQGMVRLADDVLLEIHNGEFETIEEAVAEFSLVKQP